MCSFRNTTLPIQALQYTPQVFIVSSNSEIAPQKHFSSWQKYCYYFLGIGRWSLCWKIAFRASWLTPSQGAAVGLCFLRLDYCRLRLCEVCKSHLLCIGTFVGSGGPQRGSYPLPTYISRLLVGHSSLSVS